MIKVNNLNKFFNKKKSEAIHVINNVNLTLPDTGLICILGESGSGKTTLMNVIGGIDDYKSGSIEAYGNTYKSGSKSYEMLRNENYGYIFQNFYLLTDKTVYQNISIVLDMYDLTDEQKEQRIDKVLDKCGMLKYKKRVVSQLSGGQKQRVAIARALVKAPRVVFADEPTGNLDEANTINIMSILKKISKNCLVVLVTHEKRIAQFFADEIIEILDGKVIRQTKNEIKNTYSYSDDNNLYLKEYDKRNIIKDDEFDFEYYGEKNQEKFDLKIISDNGKLYILSNNNNLVYIDKTDEKKVIDDYKPKIDMKEIDKFDYELEKISCKKSNIPKLSFKDLCKLAIRNINSMGKTHGLLAVTLLVMAIIITVSVIDINSTMDIDEQEVFSSDSHYLEVILSKSDFILDAEFWEIAEDLINRLYEYDTNIDLYTTSKVNLKYEYKGIKQIESKILIFGRYSFVKLDNLDSSKLLYGKMPEKANEIVVDKWVIENYMTRNSVVAAMIPDVRFMLDKELIINNKQIPLKIVGICDTNEPSIYIDKYYGLGFSNLCLPVCSLSTLKKEYPDEFNNFVLGNDDVLISKYIFDSGKYMYKSNFFKEFNIVGSIPNEYPANIVISDDNYGLFLNSIIKSNKQFLIYTDNKAEVNRFIKNELTEEFKDSITIVVKDPRQQDLNTYNEANREKIYKRIVTAVTIFLIAMVILYFSMKSNALNNINDIAVYRLLGITKGNIAMLFIFQIAFISIYTTILGVIVTSSILRFIGGIEALAIKVVCPVPLIVLIASTLVLLNVIISLIPIINIIKLPPAQITAKYDM